MKGLAVENTAGSASDLIQNFIFYHLQKYVSSSCVTTAQKLPDELQWYLIFLAQLLMRNVNFLSFLKNGLNISDYNKWFISFYFFILQEKT